MNPAPSSSESRIAITLHPRCPNCLTQIVHTTRTLRSRVNYLDMDAQVSPAATCSSIKGLHKLPPELRNQIYELCLLRHDKGFQVGEVTNNGSTHFLFSKEPTDSRAPYLSTSSPPADTRVAFMALTHFSVSEPALLRVSRAIRRETLPMFYGMNIFRLHNIELLKDWLSYIGHKRRAALRNVECVELPPSMERLFIRFLAPPLYHMLLAIEVFEMTLTRQALGLLPGALRFSLFKNSLSGYSHQAYFQGCREANDEGFLMPLKYFWSSGFDLAERLSDQDWQCYVQLRLAKNRDSRVTEEQSPSQLRRLWGVMIF